MQNILELKGVTKHYDGFALDHVDFAVPQGSITGLIGRNGAGKTTIFKLIFNQIACEAGEIRVLGMDHIRDEQKVKESIGAVLGENFFAQSLRPKEVGNILSKFFTTWDDRLYRAYLDRFELAEHKRIQTYSRGMKMKLSIAAALAHHPRLLLLDEATSGLDPVVRNELLDVFLDFIQDEENGILLSSHITSDLEKIADYVTYIDHGSIRLSGCKDDILEQYGVAHCTQAELDTLQKAEDLVVSVRKGEYAIEVLVQNRLKARRLLPDLTLDPASLEQIMVYTQQVKGNGR